MNPITLWRSVRRIRWRHTFVAVLANIRLYGWLATIKKAVLRLDNHRGNKYRKPAGGRGRESSEPVSEAADLFGRSTILIVGALDLPQCKKYRVTQKVEFFRSLGWNCHYSHYNDSYRVISYLQVSTALVFYRVPDGIEFNHYMEEANRLGVRTFYDIDDPIFNLAVYRENKNLDHIPARERTHLLASAEDYRKAMVQVDSVILSTAYLKELARDDLGERTYLWRNLVDDATLSIARNVMRERVAGNPAAVIIGYASGSRAHDEDFKVVSGVLARILERYEQVEIQVIGYAVMPPELERFRERINAQPFSGYAKYFEALSQIDINIVPLVDDRFNACKSAIRYIEASLCKVPTVASSVGQFAEAISAGQDGYLAGTQDAWMSALVQLIDSREHRSAVGEAAYAKVLAHHTFSDPDAIDRELLEQFVLSNE